jgi:hypothetical protein
MKSRSATPVLLAIVALLAPHADAAIAITNGDFQTSAPGASQADVVGWFDDSPSPTNWWEGAWYGPTVSPNGTSVLGLSWMGGTEHWAYQSIGTNSEGWTTIPLQFDVGSFTDAGGLRNLGVIFQLYQSDGSFTGADNTNLAGAAGVTLIDSFSISTGDIAAGAMVNGLTGSLSLATANPTGELFLRITNFDAGTGEPWAAVDNISIVPEPSIALLGGLGLFGLLRRRRA